MYYYFVKKQNRFVAFENELDLRINPWFEPFTDAQTEFYAMHPDATYEEVKNCRMTPEPEPIVIDIDERKRECLADLSQTSLNTLDKYVKAYQLANAQSTLYILSTNPSADTVYTREHAEEVIETYSSVGSSLREIYKTAENVINACDTVEDVDFWYEYYVDIYDSYEYNSDDE